MHGNARETSVLPTEPTKKDAHEFQALDEETLRLISRFISSQIGNREEAEDLTSQVFMKALRRVQAERGMQSVRKWLFVVARTTLADSWRASSRHISTISLDMLLDSDWEETTKREQPVISSEPVTRVRRLLRVLPEHYREVLTCQFLLHLSIRETARERGLTEAKVKVLQHRALKRAAHLEEGMSGTREEN